MYIAYRFVLLNYISTLFNLEEISSKTGLQLFASKLLAKFESALTERILYLHRLE